MLHNLINSLTADIWAPLSDACLPRASSQYLRSHGSLLDVRRMLQKAEFYQGRTTLISLEEVACLVDSCSTPLRPCCDFHAVVDKREHSIAMTESVRALEYCWSTNSCTQAHIPARAEFFFTPAFTPPTPLPLTIRIDPSDRTVSLHKSQRKPHHELYRFSPDPCAPHHCRTRLCTAHQTATQCRCPCPAQRMSERERL